MLILCFSSNNMVINCWHYCNRIWRNRTEAAHSPFFILSIPCSMLAALNHFRPSFKLKCSIVVMKLCSDSIVSFGRILALRTVYRT
uniref:Uncharacterized protein n=1 Tax=Parascaris equorum TaxID=6256 RepID=A0A914RW50_PAREQ